MAGFEETIDRLRELEVTVVAGSVDDREDARGTVEDLSLSFPVLWGIDPDLAQQRYGVYAHEDGYMHPLNLLLRDGVIQQVTYSSGPLGRLRPEEVVQWVEFVRGREEDGEDDGG